MAEAGPRPGYLESNSVLNRLAIPKLICTFKSIQNLKISRAQATPQTSEVTKSGVRRRLHQTQCLRLPGLSTSRTPAPCGPRAGCGHQKCIVSDLGQARRVSLYLSDSSANVRIEIRGQIPRGTWREGARLPSCFSALARPSMFRARDISTGLFHPRYVGCLNLRLSTCVGCWPFLPGKRGVGQCPAAVPVTGAAQRCLRVYTKTRAGWTSWGGPVRRRDTASAQPGQWSLCSLPCGHPPSARQELSPGFRCLSF